MTISPDDGRLIMKIGHGRPEIDAKEYLNRFDLISPIIPRPVARAATSPVTAQAGFEETKLAIMADDRVVGDSLHERALDILAQIGEWFDLEPKKSHRVEASS